MKLTLYSGMPSQLQNLILWELVFVGIEPYKASHFVTDFRLINQLIYLWFWFYLLSLLALIFYQSITFCIIYVIYNLSALGVI